MRKAVFSSLTLLLVAACSSTSGVKGELVFNTLAASDWAKYCNWQNGELGSNAGKSCGAGSLLPTVQRDCMGANAAPNCTATVSQVEDCLRKFKDHQCDGITKVVPTCNGFAPACNALFAASN